MLWLGSGCALAANVVGSITNLSGMLVARKDDGTTRILSQKSEVLVGDTLVTAEGSYARLKFTEGGEVTLRPNSQFEIREYFFETASPERDNIVLGLIKGGLRVITGAIAKRDRSKFQLRTPSGTIGIRGTVFGPLQCNNDCANIKDASGGIPANGLHVDVGQGEISVTNKGGTRNYAAGVFGYVRDINTPPVVVPAATAPKLPVPPQRFETGRAGVGRASANECTI